MLEFKGGHSQQRSISVRMIAYNKTYINTIEQNTIKNYLYIILNRIVFVQDKQTAYKLIKYHPDDFLLFLPS